MEPYDEMELHTIMQKRKALAEQEYEYRCDYEEEIERERRANEYCCKND